MASSSEIEKLERRCAENPHGLTFAPLAEAYRKHGDLDRALEVLRTGRELHPDYIPASIVLGRCHLDRGDLAEAERSFAHVLTLDPENVIALKALADLAEREGRGTQAERWLNLLLAVDPSNEDAREQLDRIRTGGAPAAAELPDREAEPAVPVVQELAEDSPLVAQDAVPDHAAMEEPPAEEPPAEEPYAETQPAEAQPLEAPHAEEHHAEEHHAEEQAPSDFAVVMEQEDEIVLTPDLDSDYRAEVPGTLPDLPDPSEFFDSYDPADAAASGLEPVPDLTSEFGPGDPMAFDEPRPIEQGAPEPLEPETLYAGTAGELPPVVTESMAELYLRQGHRADALSIYRQLAERRPDDERLASVIAGLSAEVDAAPAETREYAASQTGGRSVGDLLRGVLAERLPPAPPTGERFVENGDATPAFAPRDEVLTDADDQGEPTRPADDHLTLGAVFGEEDGGAPPAVASPDPAAEGPDAGLSFDEFFGPPPAVEPDATRSAPPAPAGDPDDLDQFHAWLQSLKR